ncbi:MAG TPA: GGDEF domain-containing protein [Pseudacidobacterium sp.]|nr:GGDEF domain-containing protein [Pseudacidobacterium sp.]
MGSVVFLTAAAFFVYHTTKDLLSARDWEEHSQEVLNTLQLTSQRLDRLDLTSRLYFAEKNRDDLGAAQTVAVVLVAGVSHLTGLVGDNPAQEALAQALQSCTSELKQIADKTSPADVAGQSIVFGQKVLDCRDYVVRMQADENMLLRQRRDESQRGAYRSLSAGAVFLLVSLVTVLVLFGLLVRDAAQQYKAKQEVFDANARLASTVQLMEQRAVEAGLLTATQEELQLCTNVAQAYQVTVRRCSQLLPSASIALLMINNSRQMLELVAASGGLTQVVEGFSLDACCGLRGGQIRWRKRGQSEIDCEHFVGAPPENYLCMPLTAHGDTLGILYVECSPDEDMPHIEAKMEALKSIVKVAAVFFGSLNLRARLENQSIRDGLTNLFNRHFMEISLDREIRRAARSRTELAVLMIDVDHFKHFNDTFGHEAGDYVLREVAEVFRNTVRVEDIICRYGGEEFVIIFPETGAESAKTRAEEIRRQIQRLQLRFRGENLRETTVSIGIAVYPEAGNSLVELLRNADRALYAAKNRGRNCVVTSLTEVTA